MVQHELSRMQHPNWACVLTVLYDSDSFELPENGELGPPKSDLIDVVSEETDLDEEQIRRALKYLNEFGLLSLISIAGDDDSYAGLSEKGFNVAHERELRTQQIRTNWVLMALTGFLAIGIVFQTLLALLTADIPLAASTILIVVFSFLLGLLWRSISDYLGLPV